MSRKTLFQQFLGSAGSAELMEFAKLDPATISAEDAEAIYGARLINVLGQEQGDEVINLFKEADRMEAGGYISACGNIMICIVVILVKAGLSNVPHEERKAACQRMIIEAKRKIEIWELRREQKKKKP